MSVEHDSPLGADFLASQLDGVDHSLDVGGVSGMLVEAVRQHIECIRCVIDPNAVSRGGTTEQPVHRNVLQLSGDVPQRDIETCDRMIHEWPAAHVAMGAKQLLAQMLDPRRVLADDQLGQRRHQRLDELRINALHDFPPADAVIGLDLHVENRSDPVRLHRADTDARRAIGDLGTGHIFLSNGMIQQRQSRRSDSGRSERLPL